MVCRSEGKADQQLCDRIEVCQRSYFEWHEGAMIYFHDQVTGDLDLRSCFV